MALLPFLFDDDVFRRSYSRWSSWIDSDEIHEWPLSLMALPRLSDRLNDIRKHWCQVDKDTSITVDCKDHFQANIDVLHFRPEEISVKRTENTVTVEAKHEEQQDEHGLILRHFVRRYYLPQDCDITKLRSSLSSDGVLSITAPKKSDEDETDYEEVPVVHTKRPVIKRPHLWPCHMGDKKIK